jgi:3-deoxy-manno-octulosonate cytidylyltransferase (CMP-KDO synthetase)
MFVGNMEIVGVIPARFASTRLPGKPLRSDTGRPLIQHVVEAARRSQSLGRIIVATDDRRIAEAVTAFGGEAVMTRADHSTGTDRVAEVAARLDGVRIIVNLQGDEPEVSGEALDRVVALLEDEDPEAPMATLATPIRDEATYRDPACVKVVCSARGRALYFSRSPIPCHRDGLPDRMSGWGTEISGRGTEPPPTTSPIPCHRDGPPDPTTSSRPIACLHLGLYAYRRDFLLSIAALPPSPLEAAEKLEQLRVLDAGYPIAVAIIEEPSIGIDTPEDYRRFVRRWRERQDRRLAS